VLAEAVADVKLAPALRIAAAAGLDRHVEAAAAKLAPTVGPPLVKVVETPATDIDPIAAAWLSARCLEMLGTLGPAAPPAAAAAAARILGDGERPADLRVRAAAALGRLAGVAKGLDFAGTRDAVLALATASLTADLDEAKRWRFREAAKRPAAADAPGAVQQPAADSALLPLACRRNAWRLATLADALLSADGTSGIGLMAGADRQAAADLAAKLRQAATAIDATPDEQSIAAALATLTGRPTPATPATDQPGAPAADSPFASPFGN
jgi:hypothetical protein